MKFIVMIEEEGYQLRYWDETKNEIGDSIVSDWNKRTFSQKIENFGINLNGDCLKKIFYRLDAGKPFVVLVSKEEDSLIPFDRKEFTVE